MGNRHTRRQLSRYGLAEQKINDMTVSVTNYRYFAPHLLSGAFIKKAIQTAGPLVALGFMVCMALIALARKREEATC